MALNHDKKALAAALLISTNETISRQVTALQTLLETESLPVELRVRISTVLVELQSQLIINVENLR